MPITPLLLTIALLAQPAAPPIVLDGSFDDWKNIEPVLVDPADAPDSPVDFRSVRITHDHEHVYLLIDFGNVVNVQGLAGRAVLFLDVDGNPHTGSNMHGLPGVDLTIEFTPINTRNPERPGRGTAIQSATYQHNPDDPASVALSPYDIGLAMAPTYASREVEFRIERGSRLPRTPELLQGRQFSGTLVYYNSAGEILDRTDAFTYELTHEPPRSRSQVDDPIARASQTDFRVLSWNAEHGSMIANPGPFARVLSALQPDIVLWQELTDKNTGEQMAAWMNEHITSTETNTQARWNVVFGQGGGNLRTAVASRLPIQTVQPLELLPFRDNPNRHVRVAAAAVRVDGKNLLVVSTHLKCCGAMDTREDRLRFVEVRLINNAVREALRAGQFDGVIIGGDLNLVGERNPKIVLGQGLDKNDSLAVVDALQLSGTTNATWSERRSPFLPGRLDFLLYSPSTMQVGKSFVFEVTDLTPKWMEYHGLLLSDTLTASDHFPVVADYTWAEQ